MFCVLVARRRVRGASQSVLYVLVACRGVRGASKSVLCVLVAQVCVVPVKCVMCVGSPGVVPVCPGEA